MKKSAYLVPEMDVLMVNCQETILRQSTEDIYSNEYNAEFDTSLEDEL